MRIGVVGEVAPHHKSCRSNPDLNIEESWLGKLSSAGFNPGGLFFRTLYSGLDF